MTANADDAQPDPLHLDVRLQGRFISAGKITQEEVVSRTLAGPDVAANATSCAAVDQGPAPARGGARPPRLKAAPRD